MEYVFKWDEILPAEVSSIGVGIVAVVVWDGVGAGGGGLVVVVVSTGEGFVVYPPPNHNNFY